MATPRSANPSKHVEDAEAIPLSIAVVISPDLLEAASEVDVTLLDWALGLSPRERLRAATRAGKALARFVHAASRSR